MLTLLMKGIKEFVKVCDKISEIECQYLSRNKSAAEKRIQSSFALINFIMSVWQKVCSLSLQLSPDTSKSLWLSPDNPESLHLSSDTQQSLQRLPDTPKSHLHMKRTQLQRDTAQSQPESTTNSTWHPQSLPLLLP